MKSPPLVSIITPTYNQESYLSHCIESALSQSYPHWEQIIVDDGSDDRTWEVVQRYGDPRIRYVRLPHRGLSALAETYNTALSLARGELVALLEGDDQWPEDKLELQVPSFEDGSTLLSWGRGTLIDAEGKRCGEHSLVRTTQESRCFSSRDVFHRLTRVNLLTPSITVMVRKSVLDAIGGFKQTGSSLFVDLPTWLWITATHPGQVCYLNATLGYYRVHPHQTSQRYKTRMDAEHLQVLLELERLLDPDTLRKAGWDAAARRRAILQGLLIEGRRQLDEKQYRAASSRFARVLLRADSVRDRALATLGLLSAASRLDLLTTAYALRGFALDSAQLLRPRKS